jgi:hypothetical protein
VVKLQTKHGKKEEVIAVYNEEMIKRGQVEVNLSLETSMTIHEWKRSMESPLMKHGVTKMS